MQRATQNHNAAQSPRCRQAVRSRAGLLGLGLMLACLSIAGADARAEQDYEHLPGYGEVGTVLAEELSGAPRVAEAYEEDDAEAARGVSWFPEDPESYEPMPLPEEDEYDEYSRTEPADYVEVVTVDLETGEEWVWDMPEDRLGELLFDWTPGSPGQTDGPEDYEEYLQTLRGFTSLSGVSSTSEYPWRINCKIFFKKNGGNYVCSGTLIDARHVLTAGHCIHEGSGGDWATDVVVVPAYDNGSRPYGDARGTHLHSWNGWTADGDYNYDMGVIELDRPIGAITGWFGYGYKTGCDFFTGNTFHNASYPAEGAYNGCCMYYWYGSYDSCPSSTRARVNRAGWGGMSGSGTYFKDGSTRRLYGVASTSDRSTNTVYARMSQSTFEHVRDGIIADNTPSAIDLIPLNVKAAPGTASTGYRLAEMSYLVHNDSAASWEGTVSVNVYLSTNNNISDQDTLIQTHTFTWDFGPKSAVRITLSTPPIIPAGMTPGTYYVGVILDKDDHDTSNNDSDGQDARKLTVTQGTSGPQIRVGAQSLQMDCDGASLTIHNDGTAALDVSAISVPWWITVSPAAPFSIAAAGSRTLDVQVDCDACAGADLTGELTISSDDGNRPTVSVDVKMNCDYCGDGTCNDGEDCGSCPQDCGSCCNDADGDGVCDGDDNCPQTYNPSQRDSNGNGWGDACNVAPPDPPSDPNPPPPPSPSDPPNAGACGLGVAQALSLSLVGLAGLGRCCRQTRRRRG